MLEEQDTRTHSSSSLMVVFLARKAALTVSTPEAGMLMATVGTPAWWNHSCSLHSRSRISDAEDEVPRSLVPASHPPHSHQLRQHGTGAPPICATTVSSSMQHSQLLLILVSFFHRSARSHSTHTCQQGTVHIAAQSLLV